MAFGIGFITLTFMGFLTGFCLGKYVLVISQEESLILSLVTGIGTLILESCLMLVRLHKWEKKHEAENKRHKLD
jgi:hypothetical protein